MIVEEGRKKHQGLKAFPLSNHQNFLFKLLFVTGCPADLRIAQGMCYTALPSALSIFLLGWDANIRSKVHVLYMYMDVCIVHCPVHLHL